MRVWTILMTFPLPSETFVCNDVAALRRIGVDVAVHALLPARPDADEILAQRGLADLEVTHGGGVASSRGLVAALRRPGALLYVLGWILSHSVTKPVHLVKSLVLVPRALDLLARALREKPDVVHLYWGHYPAVFGALVARFLPGTVVSMSLSAYDLLRAYPGSARLARSAGLVSTWAGANLPAIEELGVPRDEVHLSWQGVDLRRLPKDLGRKEPRRIVTAGRLVEAKGMDDVLRAFARVVEEWPDARLVVLGDGPDRTRLEQIASELGLSGSTEFRGHVAHDEVFEEMARSEIFVFMSRYAAERLPNVVKEAMACRCVVVSTWTPGMEELMTDGEHGFVVPQGAVDEVAAKIGRVLASPEAAAAMVEAGERRVHAHFDLEKLMAGFVQRWRRAGESG